MFQYTRIVALSLLCLIFSTTYAQDKGIDSLKTAIANPKLHDTTRISMIYNYAATQFTNNFDPKFHTVMDMLGALASKNYAKKNSPLLQKKYTKWLATYNSTLGNRYLQQEKYDKSALHFDKAAAQYKSLKAYDDLYTVYLQKAQLYRATNEKDKAIALIFDVLKFYEKDKKTYLHSLHYVYATLAFLYRYENEYEQAIKYSLKAEQYCDLSYKEYPSNLTLNWKASVLGNIAYCYSRLKRYKEALSYSYRSLEIDKKIGAKVQAALSLAGAADMQMKLSNFAEAEKLFQELVDMQSSNPDNMTMGTAYLGLGELSFKKGDLVNAEIYEEKAFVLAKKTTNKTLQGDVAEMLYKINLANKNYEKALHYYEFDKKIADSTQIASSKKEISQQQLKYEFEKKELQQKIIQQKKLEALKLQAAEEQAVAASQSKLEQQQLRYDFEKKQLNQKIEQGKKLSAIRLESQKKTAAVKLEGEKEAAAKNNWLIALSGLLLLLVVGAYFYYRNSKQKQSIAALEKEQIKQKLLITQMNPHFIFNSIENIQGLIYADKDEAAVDYLSKFSVLTRQILEHSNENYISLDEEIHMIKNYLSIQQLLYDNKFDFTVSVEESIDTESMFLPPMLTQPFIENAIKHGLAAKDSLGKIDIRFFLNDGKLFFEVLDNGSGFDLNKKATKHKSLAMTITKERLIGYTKNTDFVVQTDNITDQHQNVVGAKVIFEIPYIYEN